MKLLLTSPEVFERSNVHSAGMVILAFKQLVRRRCAVQAALCAAS